MREDSYQGASGACRGGKGQLCVSEGVRYGKIRWWDRRGNEGDLHGRGRAFSTSPG